MTTQYLATEALATDFYKVFQLYKNIEKFYNYSGDLKYLSQCKAQGNIQDALYEIINSSSEVLNNLTEEIIRLSKEVKILIDGFRNDLIRKNIALQTNIFAITNNITYLCDSIVLNSSGEDDMLIFLQKVDLTKYISLGFIAELIKYLG